MIALVDSASAEVGYEFVYLGKSKECLKCGVRTPCHHNLEAGRRYSVTHVTDKTHPCRLFEEVVVCHVQEVGIDIAVIRGSAFEGATTQFRPLECEDALCDFSHLCIPEGLKKGDKCIIEDLKDRIRCPKDRDLQVVTVRRT